MGKSYRHTAIAGVASSSEKEDKRKANRKFRRISKERIRNDLEPLYDLDEAVDKWSMSKDGSFYFDENKYPDLMRK